MIKVDKSGNRRQFIHGQLVILTFGQTDWQLDECTNIDWNNEKRDVFEIHWINVIYKQKMWKIRCQHQFNLWFWSIYF